MHLLVRGLAADSDLKMFVKLVKQHSAIAVKRRTDRRLWQRYSYERVMRDDREAAYTIGYILKNPVRAGLVAHRSKFPHIGSSRYSAAELLKICEYDGMFESSA